MKSQFNFFDLPKVLAPKSEPKAPTKTSKAKKLSKSQRLADWTALAKQVRVERLGKALRKANTLNVRGTWKLGKNIKHSMHRWKLAEWSF